MDMLPLLMVVLITGLFALGVLWMVRSERAARQKKRQDAEALGFAPLAPPPDLTARIGQVYHSLRANRAGTAARQYRLKNVYYRRLLDADAYIFDLETQAGGESSDMSDQSVAIVSPRLDLPAFLLFPKADVDGQVAKLGNRLLTWIVSRAGELVPFSEHPDFDRRYLVSGPDGEAIRRCLDERRLARLAATRLAQVEAMGDTLVVSRLDAAVRQPEGKPADGLPERVRLAREIYETLTG